VNPYVFIVGAPRSGTTLLRRMVDAHPEIAITRETHWITQLLDGDDPVDPERPVGRDILARLAGYERFARMGVDLAELEHLFAGGARVSYSQLVSAIFDAYGRAQGKPHVGDKVPGYVTRIPVLSRLFPDARFVHLIRDGRDVCLSVLDWDRRKAVARLATWKEEPVATTALWWERLVRHGREDGATLGPERYHEVAYEAVVAAPEETCAALCGFLGLPYEARMLTFHEGRTRHEPGLDAKKAWRPITPGLRNWRTEMTAADLDAFEAVAGELLTDLGYPRGAPDPGSEARRRAESVRQALAR
jgi:Sulfotransferase family